MSVDKSQPSENWDTDPNRSADYVDDYNKIEQNNNGEYNTESYFEQTAQTNKNQNVNYNIDESAGYN